MRLSQIVIMMAAGFLAMTKIPLPNAARGAEVVWISSNDTQPWQQMASPPLEASKPETPPEVRITPRKTYQTIDGFGGCFNELGWTALAKAAEPDRAKALAALFGDEGCAFHRARLPIGASDFALDAYSLDDTPGDLELKDFSIERDKHRLIPYVKAALKVRPSLQCWGSPWSPPAWMKTSNNYSQGSLKWEPAILRAYAKYLDLWVKAYRAEGIGIYALCPQNEPNILNVYPTCLWTGPQLREFIGDYLGPALRESNVELWLGLNGGAPNDGDKVNGRLVDVMEDPKASAFIGGIGLQYDGRNQIGDARELYPDKKLIQTETVCRDGSNSWADAQALYGLMKDYLANGASAYFAWNMVLNETGMSSWNWKQNALITVDSRSGKVTYNGEYYVMRHFSQYVKPGAKRVLTTGWWGDKIAFLNPDGSVVLVAGNSLDQAFPFAFTVAGQTGKDTVRVSLPARSINTFILPP